MNVLLGRSSMIAGPAFFVLVGLAVAQPPITGEVVDAQGKPVPDAEVALSAGLTTAGTLPVVAQTRTDDGGRFTFRQTDLERQRDIGQAGTIWAFKSGLGLDMVDLLRNDRPDQVHRLVLEPAAVRTLTLRDAEGKPVAGAIVAPRLIQIEGSRYTGVQIPDAWLDRLSATTDARGDAPLPSLTRVIDLRTVLVTVPGRVRHVLPLPYSKSKDDVTLTVGAPGRLAGRIEVPSGAARADITVEVWARCGIPVSDSRDLYSMPERVGIEPGLIRVRADGFFETPQRLTIGTTYRVVVRRDGFALALSEWIRLGRTPVASVSLTLRAVVKIEGRVIDRQGKPVAGVSVSQAAGGPASTSDEAGRFVLAKARPGHSFLIARKEGFRFHGMALGPRGSSPVELVITWDSEPPEQRIATLPEPVPLDESRALARRVLDPIMQEAMAKGGDAAKLWLIRFVRWLDPPAILEQVEKTKFQSENTADYLKGEAALGLAASDPDEAAAVAEMIADPGRKAGTLVDLVDALPATERARKLALLDRAATQVRTAKQGSNKLYQMGEVAERWLELGEKDKALALFAEGRTLVEALPPLKRTDAGSFLAHLARVDPKTPLELLKGVGPDRWNQRMLANVASRLAFAYPAEAEHALGLLHEPLWRQDAGLRVCRRLARTDPDRARRIAAGFPNARERAYAWTFLADGLIGTDPSGARAALGQALREIDSLPPLESPGVWSPGPAASILPLVERIAPERVTEVFWRALDQQTPGDDPRGDFGSDHNLVDEALLLSRYDRTVAATLFAPVAAFARSIPLREVNDLTPSAVLALGCLDPHAAVTLIEGLPKARSLDINEPTNWARSTLADHLAMPPDRRWMRIWRFHAGCGIALFEEIYRDL